MFDLSLDGDGLQQIKHSPFPLPLQELLRSLPVEQRKGDHERVFPVLGKDRLELLVVVGKLQPHFREVFLHVGPDDLLEDLLLLLATQLFVLQQLREHLTVDLIIINS